MPYLFRTSWLQRLIFPHCLYSFPVDRKVIYLTFDDGPTPQGTEFILSLLSKYDAHATFFLLGENIEKYPQLVRETQEAGHQIGNHGYSHLNGWETDLDTYRKDFEKTRFLLQQLGVNASIFRPPYGRLTFSQSKMMRKLAGKIVMWSLLSGDFDPNLNRKKALSKLKKVRNGDVLLFHDNVKALDNLKELLPEVLHYYHSKGFEFKRISDGID